MRIAVKEGDDQAGSRTEEGRDEGDGDREEDRQQAGRRQKDGGAGR
jgi:hypothetical protein